jgi:signal transduction histidine kinase
MEAMSPPNDTPLGGTGPLGGVSLFGRTWSAGANAVSLLGLALLVWAVLSQFHTLGAGDARSASVVLLTAAALSWLTWMLVRPLSEWGSFAALGAMSVTGGALAAFMPVAMIFPAVAVLNACMRWRNIFGVAVGAAGWLAMAVGVLALGKPWELLLGGLAAILGGAVVGITRRQGVEQAEQMARMEVEMARTEVERARAELLSERNHLAREIHDVLAHTLAALSLQLEAFGTVVDAEPATSPAVREQLERTRMLVREGLDEARGAVGALRDEPAPLGDQLAKLSAQHQAAYTETGRPQRLSAPMVLGLYRVAQEALTNVVKHAPGAVTTVLLHWSHDEVSVTVENGVAGAGAAASASLGHSGGGYGLRGIAERLELLGGTVESGPTRAGWRVSACVPFEPPGPNGAGGPAPAPAPAAQTSGHAAGQAAS